MTSPSISKTPGARTVVGSHFLNFATGRPVWQFKDGGKTIVFKLRNAKFSNGSPVTSADVKYCFEQYAKEGVQSFNFQEIEGIETPDKYTLRIHLKTPNTLFPQNLAEPVAATAS